MSHPPPCRRACAGERSAQCAGGCIMTSAADCVSNQRLNLISISFHAQL